MKPSFEFEVLLSTQMRLDDLFGHEKYKFLKWLEQWNDVCGAMFSENIDDIVRPSTGMPMEQKKLLFAEIMPLFEERLDQFIAERGLDRAALLLKNTRESA